MIIREEENRMRDQKGKTNGDSRKSARKEDVKRQGREGEKEGSRAWRFRREREVSCARERAKGKT